MSMLQGFTQFINIKIAKIKVSVSLLGTAESRYPVGELYLPLPYGEFTSIGFRHNVKEK